MLTENKILTKLKRISQRYDQLRFEKIADIPMKLFETREHFRRPPGQSAKNRWRPAPAGTKWGGSWITGWFCGKVTLPKSCTGKEVFITSRTDGETLCFVDGKPKALFDHYKQTTTVSHLHPAIMLTKRAVAGKTYNIALEVYSGHYFPGDSVWKEPSVPTKNCRLFEGAQLVHQRDDVIGFVLDLKVLNQLAEVLDENSLRRGKIVRTLAKVYALIDTFPEETCESSWRPKLAEARKQMRPILETKNGPSTPVFGAIGHSHLDTAWVWPIAETWRKAARTFATALALMERYPEYRFIQSSPYHSDAVKNLYPDIFKGIKKRVAEGRWEPNGGMWIEADTNIPSGESLVRQFLVGQNATREMFGYTSDTFWAPDTFGHSAALPQILLKSGIEYFCFSKLLLVHKTRLPCDIFHWKGIDGSSVFTHMHSYSFWPDPETLIKLWNDTLHKDVQDRSLCAFGYGDGGGGPSADMLEVVRRMKDIEGCPRTEYMTVSDFMKNARDELTDLPEWNGELYLETHRGTYTSIAELKRLNRKCEQAFRQAEFLLTLAALSGSTYPSRQLLALWKQVLINQFHDILPGSCFAEVNDQAIKELKHCLDELKKLSLSAMKTLAKPAGGQKNKLLIFNSLNWQRNSEIVLEDLPKGLLPTDQEIITQWIEDISGKRKLVMHGFAVDALGAQAITLEKRDKKRASSVFKNTSRTVESPFARIRFDSSGRMVSFVDKTGDREIVRPNGSLNAFYIAEDIPIEGDNWDINRDYLLKIKPDQRIVKHSVVADGPLQLRIRSQYKIGDNSTLAQDMVIHATTARIDFETIVDWNETHKLLKVGFDLDILTDVAKHEIQFGHIDRPTHQNLAEDKQKFEVCAHKWTDISENDFGVALLNDCKYGVSTQSGRVSLTLLKSGTHPDTRGDQGKHLFTYAILPHAEKFSVASVVREAYELNLKPMTFLTNSKAKAMGSLVSIDATNVIVESIKWAEAGKAFVIRFYEAGKTGCNATIRFGRTVKNVCETNLLEEKPVKLKLKDNIVKMYIKPFEIKTLRCQI